MRNVVAQSHENDSSLTGRTPAEYLYQGATLIAALLLILSAA